LDHAPHHFGLVWHFPEHAIYRPALVLSAMDAGSVPYSARRVNLGTCIGRIANDHFGFLCPAAIDFDRYRANAYIAVFVSRTFGATFFFFAVVLFGQPLGFLSISFVDALIGLTTLYCLIRIKTLEAQHRAPIVADDQRPGQKPESFDHSPKVRSIGPTSGW
jgi:hypothetical protein